MNARPQSNAEPSVGGRIARIADRAGRAFHDRVQVMSQLVAGILHEFNTPLGALRSSIGTARGALGRLQATLEKDPEAAKKLAQQIDDVLGLASVATERIVETIETLSHFARVDRADVDEADAAQMMETALRLSGVTRNRDVRIQRAYPAPSVRARCRVREIEHVLYHIIRNASEVLAGHDDARLDVAVKREGDRVVMTVADNGPGIDPDTLPTIFEPALTTKGDTVGLGLSLATCRYIAQEHGGGLDAENPPGGGARFVFWFREAAAAPVPRA